MPPEEPILRVASIQRSCADDGPGIRTTVFLQGCPLHCPWCHNPEMRPFAPRVSFQPAKCLSCGACKEMMPTAQCRRNPASACVACGKCAAECPGGALSLLGRAMTPAQIMATVRRDRFYYDLTDGGLTLSGGEPLAQPEGARALLELAKSEGISTAVETSAAVPPETIAACIGLVDHWLVDVKASRERYLKLTGLDSDRLYENLNLLSRKGAEITLRTPMVMGFNVDEGLLAFLKECRALPNVHQAELLPYHDMGRGKAVMAGLPEADWSRMSAPPPDLLAYWRQELE